MICTGPGGPAQALAQNSVDHHTESGREPISERKIRNVITGRRWDKEPAVLAHDLRRRIEAVLEITDNFSDLGDAAESVELRQSARALVRSLTKLLGI